MRSPGMQPRGGMLGAKPPSKKGCLVERSPPNIKKFWIHQVLNDHTQNTKSTISQKLMNSKFRFRTLRFFFFFFSHMDIFFTNFWTIISQNIRITKVGIIDFSFVSEHCVSFSTKKYKRLFEGGSVVVRDNKTRNLQPSMPKNLELSLSHHFHYTEQNIVYNFIYLCLIWHTKKNKAWKIIAYLFVYRVHGVNEAFTKIFKAGGVRGLWKGCMPNVYRWGLNHFFRK